MNIIENIKTAFSSVFANKMRTFLTMLGIIIGISSVIMITSLGNGAKEYLNKEFSKIKSNLIGVYLRGWGEIVKDDDYLDFDDVDLLAKHSNVEYVAPFTSSNCKTQTRNPYNEQVCYILGTTEDYQRSGDFELVYGRFLNKRDNLTESKVCVIDEMLANIVFGRTDVLGESIKFEFSDSDETLTIVGVLKTENGMMVAAYSQCQVFTPIEVLNNVVDNDGHEIDNIYIGIKDMTQVEKTTQELIRLLEIKHNNTDKYGVETYAEQVKMINNTIGMFTKFIGFVAAISLLVGGVGVMNIMLVTVTERTREIGIRKSLGATDSNIRVQFLVEAMILSFTGGIIGILFGYLGGLLVCAVISTMGTVITPVVSIPTVAATVIISSSIGIIFGVYPAGKAAKLDPIEALRYE